MKTDPSQFDSEHEVKQESVDGTQPNSPLVLQLFYDGACPLCRREVAWIRKLDRRSQIMLTDISAGEFQPAAFDCSREQLMSKMHARLPDGQWVTGMEAFRRIYAAIGFRWLIPVTRLPVISHLLEAGYRLFARHRLRITGRGDVDSKSSQATTDESNL